MENNERDRKLDQWLDKALSEYSAAEPRFGLEQRVLNRVRSEQRSRKWSVWRWMPAFAAIAVLVVVAVAVRPMLEKKVPVRQMNSPIKTYSRPAAETAKSSDIQSLHQKADAATKPANQPELDDRARGASPVRRELARVPRKEMVLQGGDQDRLTSVQAANIKGHLDATRPFDKKAPVFGSDAVSTNSSIAAMAPPPPPPPPVQQVGPGVGGGIVSGDVANAPTTAATTAPVNVDGNVPKSSPETAEVQAAPPALLADKVATESMKSITKDSRRKEAHTRPEASRQDANSIEAFGVTVRFQTGPETQQFPTPVPLSNQEKLALKAGQQLKDSAVAAHKSTEITPIEIKDVEIKPLEGPEKEK